ncbi:UNVERIFIED_CONTAM: hypothetical protein HDU68_005378 [Siphonaria sp. JEL0065]|nr:hypothetical protein HDU68_005378 [Siphonaria sp. JEL0065]
MVLEQEDESEVEELDVAIEIPKKVKTFDPSKLKLKSLEILRKTKDKTIQKQQTLSVSNINSECPGSNFDIGSYPMAIIAVLLKLPRAIKLSGKVVVKCSGGQNGNPVKRSTENSLVKRGKAGKNHCFKGACFRCDDLRNYVGNFKHNEKNNGEKAENLRQLKKQELTTLRVTNGAIKDNWSDSKIDIEARKIVTEKICPILNSSPTACVYPFFAISYRQETKSTAFLTQRGGSYASASPNHLWSAGFKRMMLYEQRNWVNMAGLEKRVQQILAADLGIPIGRRLFRNYFGGGRAAKDGEHMMYGLYLTYCETGFGDFVLNV